MSSKPVVVLSNQVQLDAFRGAGHQISACQVLCDDARFHEFLEQQGIAFQPLDEFILRSEWSELNAWGCSQAGRWIQLGRTKQLFEALDIPSVMFHFFSRMLIQVLKLYRYAEWMIEQYRPTAVAVFEGILRLDYPHFSGNYILNYFLKQLARERGIRLEQIDLPGTREEEIRRQAFRAVKDYLIDRSPLHEKWMRKVKQLAKRILLKSYGTLVKPPRQTAILASGQLRHLESVIVELRRRKYSVVLYDPKYDLTQYRFARQHRIHYCIPECFKPMLTNSIESWTQKRREELDRAMDLAALEGLFQFRDRDFSSFIREEIITTMGTYLSECAQRCNHYEVLFQEVQPLGVVLNEDFSLFGGLFAAFARAKAVPVYCISHHSIGVDFKIPKADQTFHQSTTFVNSEYEKEMYEARGWNGRYIAVTGTPRYDRLMRMRKAAQPYNRAKRTLKLLYCATGLWNHTPNQRGFLGLQITIYRQNQLPLIRAVLDVIPKFPVELLIKPHSNIAMPLWKRLLAEEGHPKQVKLLNHREDIFRLYQLCDAMIAPYWSTAIFETAMIGLPTIFLDLNHMYGPALHEFASHGFCRPAKSKEDLRNEIVNLCTSGDTTYGIRYASAQITKFLGYRDSSSTTRVTDRILGAHQMQKDKPLPSLEEAQVTA